MFKITAIDIGKKRMPKVGSPTFNFLIYLFIVTIGFQACNSKEIKISALALDTRYADIKQINSFANCHSSQGDYTTEVKSSVDGTCYFTQKSDDGSPPFMTKINAENEGFLLDEEDNIMSPLSAQVVEMIRGHDFHRMHTNPGTFFNEVQFDQKMPNGLERYTAKDKLGHIVKFYYDGKYAAISKLDLINPLDTTQLIEIINKKWSDSQFGKLAKEIEVIQGQKDTFIFDFKYVKIND